MNGKPWSREEHWELLGYAERLGQREAAQRLGRTESAVASHVRDHSIRWRGGYVTTVQLAAELGCSATTVASCAHALGVPATGTGNGRRFHMDAADADRVRSVLTRRLGRNAQNREAGRQRHTRAIP